MRAPMIKNVLISLLTWSALDRFPSRISLTWQPITTLWRIITFSLASDTSSLPGCILPGTPASISVRLRGIVSLTWQSSSTHWRIVTFSAGSPTTLVIRHIVLPVTPTSVNIHWGNTALRPNLHIKHKINKRQETHVFQCKPSVQ